MRDVLDEHSKSIQPLQTTRKRIYNDELYYHDSSRSKKLPNWTYSQKQEPKGKGKKKEKEKTKESPPKRRRVTDYEESVIYLEETEHQTGESARIGEIREAIIKEKEKETKESEESKSETELLNGVIKKEPTKVTKKKRKEKEVEKSRKDEAIKIQLEIFKKVLSKKKKK